MDRTNTEVFLALFAAALKKENLKLTGQIDAAALFRLAQEQHVLPMILEPVWQSPSISSDLLAFAQSKSVQIVIGQAQRTAAFLRLYQSLAEEDLYPIVMKGIICRSLYPQPDQRPSGDEDLLIEPKDLFAVDQVLRKNGYTCTAENPDASLHEITYTSPLLHIELHLSLFAEDSDAYGELEALFCEAPNHAVTVRIDNTEIMTLAPTDHFLYLLCHAYKHFLHSGVGIRQVADMAMFANAYGEEIDWDYIYTCCKKVKIETFSAALLKIAHKYLTLSSIPVPFAGIETDEKALLEDIMSGGIYGKADPARVHSSNLTLDAVAAHKQGKKSHGIFQSIFPEKKYLQSNYPYAKEYPVLLPAAWLQRIFQYMKSSNLRKGSPAKSLQIGRSRIELLKKYKII